MIFRCEPQSSASSQQEESIVVLELELPIQIICSNFQLAYLFYYSPLMAWDSGPLPDAAGC